MRRYYWFVTLLCAICLEGLGRKYLPGVPSAAFYFFKDLVLVAGYFMMRPSPEVSRTAKWLYRGFGGFVVGGLVFTTLQMFNPDQPSLVLGLIGNRAYWLWWLAPPLIATALRNPRVKRRAFSFLVMLSLGISALAALQFASPSNSAINIYSTVGGEQVYASVAEVTATGRARVSGTFSFLTGFSAFITLVPTLLLGLGLEAKERKLRRLGLIGTFVSASVLPMSGSRGSVVIGVAVLAITAWTAGLFFTRVGRRVLVGAVVAAMLSLVVFPDAFKGVQSRFENAEETRGRFLTIGTVLPPVALSAFDYPVQGLGTGMQQNARMSMGIPPQRYEAEIVAARQLIELGPVGYVLVWSASLGLIFALIRASSILKRAGRRAVAGTALSYAAITPLSNTAFDHISQSLYFVGLGFLLSEVLEVLAAQRAARQAAAAAAAAGASQVAVAPPAAPGPRPTLLPR